MSDLILRKACPILSCKERIPYEHFACKDHWYELPPNLRSKVYHAYRFRLKTGDLKRHLEAVSLCLDWYREEGGYALR